MILTKEYLDEQRDTIKRNFEGYERNINDPVTKERLDTLKRFIDGNLVVLSVGSGGFEPLYIDAGWACDVDFLSYELLKKQGWTGTFEKCSCDALPFQYQSFDCAVCSEVIEHLPELSAVSKTFSELDRVAKLWIVTTPTRDVQEPTHKFIFTLKQLQELTVGLKCRIERHGLFFYIHNGKAPLFD